MAGSNAPEHKDRGLFGMFGKKDEEKQDEYMQQQSNTVDPYAPSYTGGVQHAPASAVSHQPQSYGQEEGGNQQYEAQRYSQGEDGKLNRSNSSSSSSGDEDGSGGKKEGRKKKGMRGNREGYEGGMTNEEPQKLGMMEKIKQKLPGGRKEGQMEL